jgi:hypothetical protein
MTPFNVKTFDVEKYNAILERGLCAGVGNPHGRMCIEAAICNVLGLAHGDNPRCVAQSVRNFKIMLNDAQWSTSVARAKGLHDLGLAQLGSLGVVNDLAFCRLIQERCIRAVLPKLIRLTISNEHVQTLADICESNPSIASALAVKEATGVGTSRPSDYGTVSWYVGCAAQQFAIPLNNDYPSAGHSVTGIRYANNGWNTKNGIHYSSPQASDDFLILGATLALEVLKELQSPGCKLLA